MSRLASPEFAGHLVDDINANPAFAREAQWFDGSILLDDGSGQVWLKVYGGKVIDHFPFVPPTGYTFKIVGASDAWDELVGGTKFTDLVMGGTRRFDGVESVKDGAALAHGRITFEGNSMEAFRLIEAIYLITDSYATTAQNQESAA